MDRLILWAVEQTDGGGGGADPVSLLLAYGPLGIFAGLMILYTKTSISREREKTDRAEAQVQELNDYIRGELLPKQIEQSMLHKQVADVLEQAIEVITEMNIRENIIRQDKGPPFGPGGRRG